MLYTTDSCGNTINATFSQVLVRSTNTSLSFFDGTHETTLGVLGITSVSLALQNAPVGSYPIVLSSPSLNNEVTITYNVRPGIYIHDIIIIFNTIFN